MILFFWLIITLLPWISVGLSGKVFFHVPTTTIKPQLVLISGCTGAGKSSLGMSVALNQGIVKCISTDTIRQVLRSVNQDPALHRSSYAGNEDPVIQWKECCAVLQDSIENLIDDCLKRGTSLVLEGVHLVPNNDLLLKWREHGGVALGCVLSIRDEEAHRQLIFQRGQKSSSSHNNNPSNHLNNEHNPNNILKSTQQILSFARIRCIQSEMIRLAKESHWLLIEQKIEQDPIDIIHDSMMKH